LPWLRLAALAAGATALLWLERRYPLRQPVEPGPRRLARNLAVGALTAATVSSLERPIVTRVARITEARRWGLVQRLPVPPAVRTAIAVVLMDYTLYWWHVLLHKVPPLWRTHEPHHIDRDLDASTGVRFHALEFVASVPWRCAQVAAIGAGPRALALWQKLTLIEVLFHHSNLRLPRNVERVLAAIIVTPRLHGLHHSIVREERDSNFSSGLSAWDRLHGTARDDFARDDVTIGLPDQRGEITLAKTLALPFKEPPPSRSPLGRCAPCPP
jgi:sterol desaturase/sphingolipid hydroxylase (fatty acid hydroxylase superfamily)